ncbi:MAG: BlaI/MecI/CopY family transcriptional regulator [Verrucomicrobiales bacterium]|nr:BlaI/MecI/CopY family transcriptional regulator [Verrucomicrobiales bacterium]
MSEKTRTKPRPTEAELEILQVLWNEGPSTVRAVHEALVSTKATGYTTTLKLMQKMADKGLVTRDESRRSHVYTAAMEAEKTQRQLVQHLLHGAFGGAPGRMVMQALSENPATEEELAEIRQLLDELEHNKRNGETAK